VKGLTRLLVVVIVVHLLRGDPMFGLGNLSSSRPSPPPSLSFPLIFAGRFVVDRTRATYVAAEQEEEEDDDHDDGYDDDYEEEDDD